MKREELEKIGLNEEQINKVLDMHHKEMSPLKEELKEAKDNLENEQDKIKSQNTTINNLKKDLEEFKDADVSGMKQKIADLEKDIKEKDNAHAKAIADRDFNDLLKDSISKAHGLNSKAITALLDVDTLKASKNQKEDIEEAIKALSEADDSKMLFGGEEPSTTRKANTIGSFNTGKSDEEKTSLKDALKEIYN